MGWEFKRARQGASGSGFLCGCSQMVAGASTAGAGKTALFPRAVFQPAFSLHGGFRVVGLLIWWLKVSRVSTIIEQEKSCIPFYNLAQTSLLLYPIGWQKSQSQPHIKGREYRCPTPHLSMRGMSKSHNKSMWMGHGWNHLWKIQPAAPCPLMTLSAKCTHPFSQDLQVSLHDSNNLKSRIPSNSGPGSFGYNSLSTSTFDLKTCEVKKLIIYLIHTQHTLVAQT